MPIPVDRNNLYEKLDKDKIEITDKISTLNNNVVFLIKEFDKVLKLFKKQ